MKNRLLLLFLVLAISLCSPLLSFAADLDILDKQRYAPPEPKSLPSLKIVDEPGKPRFDQSVRFTLAGLRIEGGTVFTEQALLAPYGKLNGTTVSFDQISSIAEEMTKKYRDAGYLLSQVVMPAQEVDAANAVIRLVAIEGYISDIEYKAERNTNKREPDAQLRKQFEWYFSGRKEKLLAMRPLRHSDFEREMLLIQDLPGITVSTRFRPGSERGASILEITLERKWMDLTTSYGNTGTKTSGPHMFSATVNVNSLPVIGSRTTVSYTQAEHSQEYASVFVEQSQQFSNGLRVYTSYAYSESPKAATELAKLFDHETKSNTVNVGFSYPILRSRDMNLYWGMNYEHRNSYADLLDERFTTDRLRNISMNLNFDFSDELGGVTQIIPSVTQGLNIFKATDKSFESASPLANAKFVKGNVYVSRNQPLPNGFSIFAAGEGQISDTVLYSYNKYSLGGSQFGRGYNPGVIEGDNALAASIEPRWTYHFTDHLGIQPYIFVDWGIVWSSRKLADTRDEENLASAGIGFRLWGSSWGQDVGKKYLPDFSINCFLGKPLKAAGDESATERLVVQAILFF